MVSGTIHSKKAWILWLWHWLISLKTEVLKSIEQGLIDAHRDGKRYYRVKKDVNYNQVQTAKTFPIFKLGRFKGGVIYESTVKETQSIRRLGQAHHR